MKNSYYWQVYNIIKTQCSPEYHRYLLDAMDGWRFTYEDVKKARNLDVDTYSAICRRNQSQFGKRVVSDLMHNNYIKK